MFEANMKKGTKIVIQKFTGRLKFVLITAEDRIKTNIPCLFRH